MPGAKLPGARQPLPPFHTSLTRSSAPRADAIRTTMPPMAAAQKKEKKEKKPKKGKEAPAADADAESTPANENTEGGENPEGVDGEAPAKKKMSGKTLVL